MSDKMIAIIDKPKDCQNCVWGICKYSLPLSSRRKGYTCQLKDIEDRIVDDFYYDEDVYLENCPLVSVEEYDKEIRNNAIEEFAEKFIYKAVCNGCSGCTSCYEEQRQCECEDWKSYMEIAEQMKEGKE